MPARTVQINYASQRKLVSTLLDISRFPHRVRSVRLIETHISWVLLAGRYAYKIKKALDLGFLNFTTLQARQFYCAEEIRLNRRLAPRIYLDVVPIGGSPVQPELGAQPAIEYAVRMRRFATSKQLDRLLARGKITVQHMDKLAATLAAFHRGLPRAEAGSAFGTPASIHAAAMQNFEQLRSVLKAQADRDAVAALSLGTEKEFASCEKYFERRREQGCVRECHGDLHLGNIVLIGDEPVPFDGIDFNPALRWIDVMDEASFLVMDLLHSRRADLAYRFLNAWLEVTGDYAGVFVLRFYLAYRAVVRAKVGAIRAFQHASSSRQQAQALSLCRSYLALAGECFARRRPELIITHGLPGSGKSTFAQAALERMQAIRIRSDVERKRLFGLGPLDDSHSQFGTGIYTEDATRRTYARLLEIARELLDAGFPVIVDAAFPRQEERAPFQKLAQGMGVPFVIASIQASKTTLSERILRRRREACDASEADVGVLQEVQAVQQPLLPHELACSVEFINDTDHNDIASGSASWGRLDELLAAHMQ